jgi:CSLREA domain-containing protein
VIWNPVSRAIWMGRRKTLGFGLGILVALLFGLLLTTKLAHADATFTVNRTGNESDANQGNGVCDALLSTAGNQCSLRAAIQEANHPNNPDADTIEFEIPDNPNIAGLEVKTIAPTSLLPTITDTVSIDGYSQTGATPNGAITNANSAVLKIQLSGANAPANAFGLAISGAGAAGTTIKGLVINRFADDGVFVSSTAPNTVIEGNFIGTNAAGDADLGNGSDGVTLLSSGNVVGGAANAAQNVISGNGENGVAVKQAGATGNTISNNHIGTDADASEDLGNSQSGVFVEGAPGVVVGGNGAGGAGAGASGEGNIISGNNEHGVEIIGDGASGARVLGNFIGVNLNSSGFSDIGNSQDGVFVSSAPQVEVGGTVAGQGNTISDNGDNGVQLFGSTSNNEVLGNRIGTNRNGSSDFGNADDGVLIRSSGNVVGGTATGARNVISGNDRYGVHLSGSGTTDNVVLGNRIGTDLNGTTDIGNTFSGVLIGFDADNNTVGGADPGAGNVISGNNLHGVQISQSPTGNSILGNFIGTNVNGTAALGNSFNGVVIGGSGNTVGGTQEGAGNVISGNNREGVQIASATATENQVQGNFIGTNVNGTADLGNRGHGVIVNAGPDNNTIGGTEEGARNVISGNDANGVLFFDNSSTEQITGNQVLGNFIGTDVNGTSDLGNSFDGVHLEGNVSENEVASNTISGNGTGVEIFGAGASGNDVSSNFIGTDASGDAGLGNSGFGVFINAPDNFIGSTVSGEGNTIAFNGQEGVVIAGGAATGNRILRNSIFSNGGLGIDLIGGTENANGATANDPDDPDTGPNTLQNKPVLTSFSGLTIEGNLNSTPNRTFVIQFFANPQGENEGKSFLGQESVTTNANGNVNFTFTALAAPIGTQNVTATATRAGNTSEFSAARPAE